MSSHSSAQATTFSQKLPVLTGGGCRDIKWQSGQRFHHLFENVVDGLGADAKSTVAIEFADGPVSFAELEERGNRLAHYLAANGVKAGNRVAVQFDRTIHAYASILAISKLGAAFIPLDVGFPVDRVDYILEDSSVSCVLTLAAHASRITLENVLTLSLDSADAEIQMQSSRRIEIVGTLEDDALSYVIYTSGTTGRPKGVQINHSSIVNFLQVARDCYGFNSSDRVFQSLTLAFDYAFEEIWVPLLSGACLVPAPVGVNLLGDDLGEFLAEKEITAYCSVPTILATIERELPKLRLLITSGEACPRDIAARWCTNGRRMLNLYGPTETTVSATWDVMEPDAPVTLGQPLPTYAAMIFDPDGPKMLDYGQEGELVIAGIGVADGYINRPEETSKAFIEDSVGVENNPSGMLYRSGDLARFTEDGKIEYLGRKDTQVKIRGYRIELGEIEQVARSVSGIRYLAVNPVEVEEGMKELALYFAPNVEGEVPDASALKDALKDRLPSYMVPSYFERLEELPLMTSGKIDRKQLPAPSAPRLAETTENFVEPAEGIEAGLAEILCTVMKIETVSADADFFCDLGANSLVMARYLGKVRRTLGLKKASMRQIYENSTILQLAAALDTPEPEKEQAPDTLAAPIANVATPTEKQDVATTQQTEEPLHVASRFQYVICGVLQVGYMIFSAFLLALAIDQGLRFLLASTGFFETYLRAMAVGVVAFFGLSAILIAVKWVAIGRFKEETIPLWSLRYVRFWIAQAAIQTNPLNFLVGTPMYAVYLRLLGAKVGKATLFFSPAPICTDLVTIGDEVMIRQDCRMPGYTVHRGYLHTGRIAIGDRVYVAEATTFDINSSIGAEAQVGTMSALLQGQQIEGGKRYQGCPAQETTTDFIRVPDGEVPVRRAQIYTFGFMAYSMLFWVPLSLAVVLSLGTVFASEIASARAAFSTGGIWSLLGGSLALYFGAILLALLSAMTMPKIYNYFFKSETVHPLFGWQYFIAARLNGGSNSILLQTLFGDSSLIMSYYRNLGYDLSEATQNGSNFGVQQRQHSPFLCKFNRNTLVSDGLAILNMDISRSSFKYSKIEVPADAYLGNNLHYPAGAKVGKNCLLATKAYVPIDGEISENIGLLGSPSFPIPRPTERDERILSFKRPGIFEQRLKMKLKSNLVTLGLFMFRSWSVLFIMMAASGALYGAFAAEIASSSLFAVTHLTAIFVATMVLLPIYYIAYEWAVNWQNPMKPELCSLYEKQFWDHERFWKLNINPYFAIFNGTPLKSIVLRLQGVKVGKQVYDNGVSITEPYMVEIGDYCSFNFGSTAQGHSLENATFKSDRIKIGDRCTFAIQSFVHYGAELGNDTYIETDAFVMKGSVIGDGEAWSGNPAENIERRSRVASIAAE